MDTQEWLRDIGAACDELGYGIVELKPRSIALVQKGGHEAKVEIETVFLSGDVLKAILQTVPRWPRPEDVA